MKHILLFVLFCSAAFIYGQNADPLNLNKITLQILATSDTHGRFLPYDYAVNMPNNAGSLSQIASAMRELRKNQPDSTVVVDAGDIIQDNSASLFLKDPIHPMISAMNTIGYDTLTLGNHEFNYGVPVLNKIFQQFRGTVLCGNVYNPDGTRLAAPYAILIRQGIKIGIIGMVTPNIIRWDASNLEKFKVTNPVEETKKAIAELKRQKVDVILAVEHMGENEEYGVTGSGALDVLDQCPEIDAFVAAHFHNKIKGDYFYNHLIYTFNSKNNTVSTLAADGSLTPSTLEDFNTAKAKGIVIVEPNKWGQSISQINITLTQNQDKHYFIANKGTDITTSLFDMANKGTFVYAPDPALSAQLQSFQQRAIADANSPIGTLKGGNLVPDNEVKGIEQAKLQPTPMITLINKVQMFYGKIIAGHDIDVASAAVFKDGENIKAGEIKKCDTANIYQFDNTLYVLKITGLQLKKYMEWSVGYYNKFNSGDLTVSFNKSIPGYNYDIFSGINYHVDISKDTGSRIVDLTRTNGEFIKDSDILYLATNNYRAGTQLMTPGTIFKSDEQLPVLLGKSEQTPGLGEGRIRDLIGSYIQNSPQGTITPEVENNWTLVGNTWDPKEREIAVKAINQGQISLAGIAGEQTSSNSKSVTWEDVQKTLR